jgi:hypothetical protein
VLELTAHCICNDRVQAVVFAYRNGVVKADG